MGGESIKIDPRDISIEADCKELAVVVQYAATIKGADNTLSKRKEKKKVKLSKTLKTSSDASKVASEILRKCPYIHDSKRDDLERAIQELQHQLIREELRVTAQEESRGWWQQQQQLQDDEQLDGGYEEADMSHLENYIELLYEGADKDDMRQKVLGTAMIVRLCSDVENLEVLIQHQTLMGALTRVLQEEYKKSTALCYNILRCFLAFSNFAEMHEILGTYKAGSLTLRILELEVKRVELRAEEREGRRAEFEKELKAASEDAGAAGEIRAQRERDLARDARLDRQQDKLAFICFHVLINLAEDPPVERKMVKRDLIPYLGVFLERKSLHVLYIAATFLKKLSIFDENKEACKESDIVPRLVALVTCSSEPLTVMVLRLLFNLSFDPELREQMTDAGILPGVTDLLKKPAFRACCLRLLYQLSVDDSAKSMFAYTDAVPLVCQLVLNFPDKKLPLELAALAVNLSLNSRCAEKMVAHRGLQHLVDRAVDTGDPNLFKVIRNISLWTFGVQESLPAGSEERDYKLRHLWQPVVESLLEVAVSTDDQAVLVEVLGALGNLTNADFPKGVTWSDAVRTYDLTALILKYLVPGLAQNDIVLELVILSGTLARDEDAANLLHEANLIRSLETVWIEKSNDAEIQLQLMHTFFWFLAWEGTREEILYATRCVSAMLEALDHPNHRISRAADRCLDLALEIDRHDDGSFGQLGRRLQRRRFEVNNREWLKTCGIISSKQRRKGEEKYDSEEEEERQAGGGGRAAGGAASADLYFGSSAQFLHDEEEEEEDDDDVAAYYEDNFRPGSSSPLQGDDSWDSRAHAF